jgi:sec-independent protein translocase protein TatA
MNSLHITLGAISLGEWVLPLLLIVLIFFGGKKIPELMKGLGGGIKEFKKAAKGEDESPVAKKEEETKE